MDYLLYIDPGSGSYLVQVLIAALLSVVFFFKNIMLYVRLFFHRLFGKKTEKHKDEKQLPEQQADGNKL